MTHMRASWFVGLALVAAAFASASAQQAGYPITLIALESREPVAFSGD